MSTISESDRTRCLKVGCWGLFIKNVAKRDEIVISGVLYGCLDFGSRLVGTLLRKWGSCAQ